MSKVTITQEQLDELQKAAATLNALEVCGVDNWDGYDDALSALRKKWGIEDSLEELVGELFSDLSPLMYEPSELGAGFAIREEGFAIAADYFRKAAEILNGGE